MSKEEGTIRETPSAVFVSLRKEYDGFREKLLARERSLRRREEELARRETALRSDTEALRKRLLGAEERHAVADAREKWIEEEELRLEGRNSISETKDRDFDDEKKSLEEERDRLRRWEKALQAESERIETRIVGATRRSKRVRERLLKEQQDARALKALYEPTRRALDDLEKRGKSLWAELEGAMEAERRKAMARDDDLARYRAALELREEQLYREVEKRGARVTRLAQEKEGEFRVLQEELLQEVDARREAWIELQKSVSGREKAMKDLYARYGEEIRRLSEVHADLEQRLEEKKRDLEQRAAPIEDIRVWGEAFEELRRAARSPRESLEAVKKFNLPGPYQKTFAEVQKSLSALHAGLDLIARYYSPEELKLREADARGAVLGAIRSMKPAYKAIRSKFVGTIPEDAPRCRIDPVQTEAAVRHALIGLKGGLKRGATVKVSSRIAESQWTVRFEVSKKLREEEQRRRNLRAMSLNVAAGVLEAQGGGMRFHDDGGDSIALEISFPLPSVENASKDPKESEGLGDWLADF